MKILILGFSKIKYMPYLNFYLNNLDCDNNEVHLLYWNRDLKPEDTRHLSKVKLYEFPLYMEDNINKLLKIKYFAKYKKFAKSIFKNNTFDAVIFLHSLPGVLMKKILVKNYKNKFIFDYRDITYESNTKYKEIINTLAQNSYKTFVSSEGFMSVFDEDSLKKVCVSHNLQDTALTDFKKAKKSKDEVINVSYWGFIRNETLQRRIILSFSMDKRFNLHYYGREQKVALSIKAYAKEIGADNVYFHGEYSPKDRITFAQNTDIIHNIFNDKNMMLAMSNKYYDSVVFKLPQLCMQDSFMGKRAEQKGIGLQCNPFAEDFTQSVYDYYHSIQKDVINNNFCNEFESIKEEYDCGCRIIKDFM